jgi:hypothetical protein
VVCDDDDSMWDGATSVEIKVDEGETVSCTFRSLSGAVSAGATHATTRQRLVDSSLRESWLGCRVDS